MKNFGILLGLLLLVLSCKNTTTSQTVDSTKKVNTTQTIQEGKIVLDSPKTVYDVISASTVQLVDVRTTNEFTEGHLKGALNICVTCDGFESNIKKLDKTKPVYVYCRSGHRSGNAAKILLKMGFKEIHDMDGGILAWQANNLPIEK